MRILTLMIVIQATCAVRFANAKANQFTCVTKKIIFRSTSEKNVACEMIKVDFDGRENFDISFNETRVLSLADLGEDESFYVDGNDASNLVTHFKFSESKVKRIPNEIFKTFNQLHIFDAVGVQLEQINSLTFNFADNLQIVLLYNNQLKMLNNYIFVHLKKMKVLDLSNNQINHIEMYAFQGLKSLSQLSLSNNRIETIFDSTFHPLVSLKWIWLDRNSISLIQSDLFLKDHRVLEGIYANNNKISLISPVVFDNLSKLRFLDLRSNECINKAFINHVIEENASIKIELHKCHSNYRKLRIFDERKLFTQKYALAISSLNTCLNQTASNLEEIQEVREKILNLA